MYRWRFNKDAVTNWTNWAGRLLDVLEAKYHIIGDTNDDEGDFGIYFVSFKEWVNSLEDGYDTITNFPFPLV